jgi:DMSO/TMAO reductase YedYZ molybdopterin-dependent catalytic subunit
VVAAGGGAISGWWALGWLLRVGTGQSALPMTTTRSLIAEPMTQVGTTRRRFLGFAGLTAAVGVIAAVAGRALQGSSVAETARSSVRLPAATTTPGVSRIGAAGTEFTTPGLSPLITPNADFYRIDTALVLPDVNPTDWSLTIDGMVDRPVTITFDELLAMPMVEEVVTLACVSNPVGGSLVGTAVWQGVPLATLLAQAGVQPTAQQLVGRSVDGFTVGFPVEAATDGRVALVAVGMNGEPLPVRVRHQMAAPDRADHLGRVRPVLDPSRMGSGSTGAHPVPHRRPHQRIHGPPGAGPHRRGGVGARHRHRARRGSCR